MLKVSKTKFHQNWTTKSRVIHVRFSIPRQYQMMMPSVAWVKFIKTKVIFRNHTKGVWNQVSSNSDHEIKSYSCSNSSIKMRKNEKVGKFFWVTQRGNKEITHRGRFRDYRSREEAEQIGTALEISNRSKKITNRGWDFKSEQRDFKSGQKLQTGARVISNRCRTYLRGYSKTWVKGYSFHE